MEMQRPVVLLISFFFSLCRCHETVEDPLVSSCTGKFLKDAQFVRFIGVFWVVFQLLQNGA